MDIKVLVPMSFHKFYQKSGYKPIVTTTYNFIRKTKLTNNLFQKQLYNLDFRRFAVSYVTRNELGVLNKTFFNSHDVIIVFFGFRQVCYEIDIITGATVLEKQSDTASFSTSLMLLPKICGWILCSTVVY